MTDLAQLELRIKSSEVEKAEKSLDRFDKTSQRAERGADKFTRSGERMSKTAQKLESGFAGVIKTLGPVVALFGALALARGATNTLTSIETGLVGVAKTADLSEEELGKLEDRIERLGTRIQTPIERLLLLASAAGQLGVRGVDNISKFTETVAKLETAAPSIQGEEAALALARLLALTGESVSSVDRLASVIVRLGNETAALEGEIVHAATFVGQAVATFDVSSAGIVALGAAVRAVGQRAQTAATSIARSFVEIDRAVKSGGDALEQFASIAGVSTDAFIAAFEEDKLRGFELFVQGIGRTVREGSNIADVLESVGLNGLETVRVLGALGARSEVLSASLARMSDELENGDALEREFRRGADTLDSALVRLSNTVRILTDNMLDDSTGLAGGFRGIVEDGASALRILAGIDDAADRASTRSQVFAFSLRAVAAALLAILPLKIAFFFIELATQAQSVTTALTVTTTAVNAWTGELVKTATIVPQTTGFVSALWVVIKNHPLLAAATALGIVTAALFSFTGQSEAAAKAAETYSAALAKLRGLLGQIEGSRAAAAVAARTGDIEKQTAAVEEEIRVLEDLKIEIEAINRQGFKVLISDLESVGSTSEEVSKRVRQQLTKVLVDALPTEEVNNRLARLFSTDAIVFQFRRELENALKGTDFEGLIDLERIVPTEDILKSVERISVAIRRIGQGDRAEGRQLLLANLSTLLDDLIVKVPRDTAFTVIDEQVASLKQNIIDLNTLLTTTFDGSQFTEGQLEAQKTLDTLRERLRLEEELAHFPNESKARIAAQLEEVRAVAELSGLTREEIETRLEEIETILNSIDSLEKLREARDKESTALKESRTELRSFLAELVEETNTIGKTAEELEQLEVVENAVGLAREAGIENTKLLVTLIGVELTRRQFLRAQLEQEEEARRKNIELLQEQAAEQRELGQVTTLVLRDMLGTFVSLNDQIEDFTLTDSEQRILGPLRDIERSAKSLFAIFERQRELGIIDATTLDDNKKNITRFVGEIRGELERLEDLRDISVIAEDISQSFGKAFNDVLTGASSAQDAATRFVQEIRDVLVNRVIVEPIVKELSAALTRIGADIAGVATESSVSAGVIEAAAQSASGLLSQGGLSAGAALVTGATEAAAILQAAAATTTVVGAAAGGGRRGRVLSLARGGTLKAAAGILGLLSAVAPVQALQRGGTPSVMDRGVSATLAAQGGVVDRPTLLRDALVGEGAGKEAVMPLDRTLMGQLGIMASVMDRSGNSRREVLPLDRLGDGNLGVRVKGMQRGGELSSLGDVRFGPGANLSQRQQNERSDGKGRISITVNVQEQRSRTAARRTGSAVARRIMESLR